MAKTNGMAIARRAVPWDSAVVVDGTYDRAPEVAFTMIGRKRLDNVEECVRQVLEDAVPGDLIETGVWRGGDAIFMRALLKVHRITDRTVYVADSFEGLPAPDLEKYPDDSFSDLHLRDDLAISVEEVKANFRRFGLLDDHVTFVKGWFKDTLPALASHTWSIVRLDGDLYESTMDGLRNLYPTLSPGGFLIVDDYGAYEACRKAVHDYRDEVGSTEEIQVIDRFGAFWRKQMSRLGS
jgi:hypothetical protein